MPELLAKLVQILEPEEESAVREIVSLVESLVSHPDGAEVAARRLAEMVAAKAAIRA